MAGATRSGGAVDRLMKEIPALDDAMKAHLGATAFQNSYTLHPRRYADISREVSACFLGCMETGAYPEAAELGKRLASEGLGAGPILGLASELRQFCSATLRGDDETAALVQESAEAYTSSLLEGYIKGMETQILHDQERIRRAFNDAHGLR